MPWRLFWAYFVGFALLAAALSIATKIQVRWSGLLLGIMMFLFVALLFHTQALPKGHGSACIGPVAGVFTGIPEVVGPLNDGYHMHRPPFAGSKASQFTIMKLNWTVRKSLQSTLNLTVIVPSA